MDNIHKYELSQDGRKYILSTEIIGNNMRLTCEELNNENPTKYLNTFSHDYLRILNNTFNSSFTIREAQDLVNNTIEDQKVFIENNQNSINIVLYLPNQNVNTTFILKPKVEISYSQARYLPTKTVYLPTEYIKRPTIHTSVQNDDINNDIFKQSYVSTTPKIDKINLSLSPQRNINNFSQEQTMIQTPPRTKKVYIDNYFQMSPKREQIEYIPGSPSSEQINYTTFSSNKNNIIFPNEYLPLTPTETIFSNNFDSDRQKIIELQNETNRIKIEHELLKDKTNKLIDQILQLNNQILILKEENQNLRENNNTILNSNQIYEITILKQELEKLSKQLLDAKNQKNNDLEQNQQLKIKNDEINLYKSQIEELLKSKNNLEIENNNLKLQIQELLKTNNIAQSQYQNLLKSQKYYENLIQQGPLEIVRGEIIENNNELEFLTRKICNENKKITLSLLYKATVDSDKADIFHNKCDGAKSSIVLIKSGNGKRFGGFTTRDWKGNSIDKKDDNAFIFSLDKMQIYDIIPGEDAIGCYPKYGPVFLGCQIRIYDEAFSKGGTTFEKGLNYDTKEDFELTGGLRQFEVKEIEVYSVEFE